MWEHHARNSIFCLIKTEVENVGVEVAKRTLDMWPNDAEVQDRCCATFVLLIADGSSMPTWKVGACLNCCVHSLFLVLPLPYADQWAQCSAT